MDYPKPIDRDEKLRRKWWKFVVVNGFIKPAKKTTFTGVSPDKKRTLKKLSACHGEGSQFEYDYKARRISGFFRDENICSNWNSRDAQIKIDAFRQRLIAGRIKMEQAIFEKRYASEIKETLAMWKELNRERLLLRFLLKQSGAKRELHSTIFHVPKDYSMSPFTIKNLRKHAKEDMDQLLFDQIKILQKLISKRK